MTKPPHAGRRHAGWSRGGFASYIHLPYYTHTPMVSR